MSWLPGHYPNLSASLIFGPAGGVRDVHRVVAHATYDSVASRKFASDSHCWFVNYQRDRGLLFNVNTAAGHHNKLCDKYLGWIDNIWSRHND